MFVHDKEERDKRHKIDRDYDVITISFKGKFKESVRINATYRTSVWMAIKAFFTTPVSRLGTHNITYNVSRVTIETATVGDNNEKTPD